MRLLFRLFLLILVVIPLALGGAAILGLSDQPSVNRAAEISPESVARVKRIVDTNDPRKLKSGTVRTIAVSQQDLDLAANYLANQYGHGSSQIALTDDALLVNVSLKLPRNPIGQFINIDLALRENGALPRFERARIGRLPVPGDLAEWLFHQGLAIALGSEAYESSIKAIKQVRISRDRFAVTYEWQPNLPDKLRAALLPRQDRDRIRVYHERLAEVSRSLPASAVSLVELIIPLFRLAETRSHRGDSIAENRAAILVLTLYVNGKGLTRFVPEAKEWPRPAPHQVTLNGRPDFAAHFTVSSAIAANAGGLLSDAVGLYKEIADARHGSGFSFNDIAADRAGTRFGELASGSAASAIKLQRQLSAGVNERGLMPETSDLPEYMSQSEFQRRFGGIDAPEYNKMIAEIDRRVSGLSLYR
ncbi:MAG: hypothetical protein ACREQ7_00685 [Candidatus Binatia bacterium]